MGYVTRKELNSAIKQANDCAFMADTKLFEKIFQNFKPQSNLTSNLECSAFDNLREMDRIQFLQRYEWEGLPNMTSMQLERIVYEKGQLMMFYSKETGKYYFLPYALEGTIDVYGRYNSIKPVPMGTTMDKLENSNKVLYDFLNSVNREVVKDEFALEGASPESHAVILYDRSPGISECIASRMELSREIVSFQSEMLPLLRTTLINDTGTKAMRVQNADEASNVKAANDAKITAAKNGQGFIPIVGSIDFQDLNAGGSAQTTEFLQSYQAVDNIRKSFMGLGSGAAFEKNAHMLESEQQMNAQSSDDILEDGLKCRQLFCDLANKLFGLNISVKKKEPEMMQPTVMEGEDKTNNAGGESNE